MPDTTTSATLLSLADRVEAGSGITRKERWAARAEYYEGLASRAQARAQSLEATRGQHERDIAFLTQPGHVPARAKMHDRLRRAVEWRAKADQYSAKASNLRIMASRTKGDAERQRNSQRVSTVVRIGDLTDSIWGHRRVTKVNAKSVRLEGVSCTVDRAHIRVIEL